MEGEKKINGSSYTLFELHPTEHKYVISNSKMGQTTKRLHCILGHFRLFGTILYVEKRRKSWTQMENFKLFFSQPPAETSLSAAIISKYFVFWLYSYNISTFNCIFNFFQLTCTVLSLLIYWDSRVGIYFLPALLISLIQCQCLSCGRETKLVILSGLV